MINKTSTRVLTVLSIAITIAIACSALFAGAVGAQFFSPFGYGGYGGYGYPAFDGFGGMPYGMPYGLSDFGFPSYGASPVSYGMPSYATSPVSYGTPSYAAPQAQVPYTSPAYTGQQMPLTNQPVSTGTGGMLTIPGLEGLVGFMPGENKLSLAVIPVTQQNNQLGFQVIGFAITSQGSNQAAVYSLSQPLAGIIDPSQNTLQVDLSNLANNVNQAGFISADQLYSSIRSSPQVIVIDVDMSFQGVQGSQATFSVNSVSIIPPDGKMQAFQMQQPTQLIIDSQSMRIYMVAFPQMVNAFTGFYGATYPQVLPIVYAQPIPILAPVFVPFLQPFPIFFSSFIGFNPFFFGSGFVSFFDRVSFHGGFPIHDRDFGMRAFNQFASVRGIGEAGARIGTGIGAGIGTGAIANIGERAGRIGGTTGITGAHVPGVSTGSIAGPQSGIASARAPGVSISSNAQPGAGISNVRAPGVSLGSSAFPTTGFSNVRAPGASIGSSAGMPSFTTGSMPSLGGMSHGIGSGIGSGLGTGMGAGSGGAGMRIGGRR